MRAGFLPTTADTSVLCAWHSFRMDTKMLGNHNAVAQQAYVSLIARFLLGAIATAYCAAAE
ncbi:MAG: hypothetical protein PHO08_13130 [Methylococcales bacterium]|nr:hypothetical protein [Methylococcales bacterium]MDD5630908.1 hypothetical protein [Methylococcales bacterium]